ncbi:putative ankyrin repeat protein RF_0381 [Mya arenaria]|uniref:putative ankyrin repeat protein RF_0381 n=1 Tax=Mya arenaria TaxID=6604 RepID=UPI0022E821F5|nr:putative ankyrin repeat protein RF_0381 [Mya arenaria]
MENNGQNNVRRNSRENSKAGYEKRQKRRQIRVLQESIDKRDADAVQEILKEEFDVDFQYRGQTALQLAVREGCLEICKLLITRGANVNMSDAEQNNLLNMACWKGYRDIAELLIQNEADIDYRSINGSSPAHTCAMKGNADILQSLVSAKADLDNCNLQGETPLHVAIYEQQMECIQLLVLGGASINWQDSKRRTPLMLAADLGFSDITELLVNGGANVNARDNKGSTALFSAVGKGHLNVVHTLIVNGADVDLPTTKGSSPLLESIYNSFTDIALLLIDAKCDVNQTDRLKQAPIHSAVSRASQFFSEAEDQSLMLVRRLVEAGCDVNVPDQDGMRPLYQSASGGNKEVTNYLLDHGSDINVKTNTGDTVLHGAIHGNVPEIVNRLIEAGCSLNERNNSGEHPLLTAITHSAQFEIVEALVEAGSNLDIKDKASSNTALHNAIVHYRQDAALLLIESGCDVNTLNAKRHTPLYTACEKNADVIAKKILAAPTFQRSMLTVRNIPQPLFAAVSNNHFHLVDLLIQMGCDFNMVNMDGQSPVQQALKENWPFVVKLLLSYNCDLDAHARVKRLYKCCLLHEDSHPHFDLEPIFVALTHRSVEMIKLLIDCYWKVPVGYIKELEHVFFTTPELNTHYSPEIRAEIRGVFRTAIEVPRSLQGHCRAVIRKRLGPLPKEKVEKLPLAKTLKSYIMMDESFGDLFEKMKEYEEEHPQREIHNTTGTLLRASQYFQ